MQTIMLICFIDYPNSSCSKMLVKKSYFWNLNEIKLCLDVSV